MDSGTTVTADDFASGSCAAVCGGTTTLVDFATQDKGHTLCEALDAWHCLLYTSSAFARGLTIRGNNPTNFLEVLDQQWWTIDRHLLLKDSKASADATYLDCIENGVTTVFDHHASYGEIAGSLFALAESARQFGVRTNLCYEISDRDGAEKMRAAVKENVDFIRFAQKDDTDMVKGMMGMHAPFTLSNETLEYCAAEKPEGAGYHIHVAEGIDDLYDSLTKYNKRLMLSLIHI